MTGSRQNGFALIELLVAASMMIVVLSAALFSYEQFATNTNANQAKNDAQNLVRFAMDRLAVDLRNAASPMSAQPVQRSGPYDLVFGSFNPVASSGGSNSRNYDWVRYCVDPSTPTNEVLWREVDTWTTASPPAVPSTTACPGIGWPSQSVLASHITNEQNGQNRPAFYYDSTAPPGITSVHVELYVDVKPGHPPGESVLTSGVFLRNAVPPPVASFSATAVGHGGGVVLDGSTSYDPAGRALSFQWSEDGSTLSGCTSATCTITTATGPHTFGLTVVNAASLQGTAPPQVVNVQ